MIAYHPFPPQSWLWPESAPKHDSRAIRLLLPLHNLTCVRTQAIRTLGMQQQLCCGHQAIWQFVVAPEYDDTWLVISLQEHVDGGRMESL